MSSTTLDRPRTRNLPDRLAELKEAAMAAGITAESPDVLDPEAEQLARQERQTER
jgi:hypothetical protein